MKSLIGILKGIGIVCLLGFAFIVGLSGGELIASELAGKTLGLDHDEE